MYVLAGRPHPRDSELPSKITVSDLRGKRNASIARRKHDSSRAKALTLRPITQQARLIIRAFRLTKGCRRLGFFVFKWSFASCKERSPETRQGSAQWLPL